MENPIGACREMQWSNEERQFVKQVTFSKRKKKKEAPKNIKVELSRGQETSNWNMFIFIKNETEKQ